MMNFYIFSITEWLLAIVIKWVIKLFEGLPKFMRVSREGLALLDCQFLRV